MASKVLSLEELLQKKEDGKEITDEEWLSSLLGDLSIVTGSKVVALTVSKNS